MKKQKIKINHIPALLWGEPTGHLILAIHGDQSHKEDTVIALLAEEAVNAGYQVLSFDLPEHGDRRDGKTLCKVQPCVEELGAVMKYARSLSGKISLFACSLGAYFGLVAYENENLEQALFLSPVVDMKRLIENMMLWAGTGEEQLKEEGEIPTNFGKTLYWDYYCFVKARPITRWKAPTGILYGEKDTLSEYDRVSGFAQRFHCDLTVMPQGEHFFHTQAQLDTFQSWLKQQFAV